MDIQKILDQLGEIAVDYGLKIVGALVVLLVGSVVVRYLVKLVDKAIRKGNTDPTLRPFLTGIAKALLRAMLILSVLAMLGIEMTSFIAILGAAGLAIGMALSGTLQNFAGGVMLLLFKPFKVGDFIQAQGHSGTVSEIQIFNTILKTPDNKTIIIPNGGLSTGTMTNFSTESKRRVDWTFGIGYGDDADKAIELIKRLANEDPRIHKEPAVFVEISELADSSVNFVVRAWVDAPNYWGVYFSMNKNVYQVFAREGLNIPYPQMDIHVHNQPA